VRKVIAMLVPLVVGLAATGCGGDATSGELRGYVPPSVKEVASVSVTEVTGDGGTAPFTFEAPSGGLLVVYFGYTNCPDLCPTTLFAVRTALADLGDRAEDVEVAMVTVDPERDTAEVLPAYLASFVDRYRALVPAGDAELDAAEAAFRASSGIERDDSGAVVSVSHSTMTYVVDDTGRVVVEWPFGQSADDMAHDLSLLLSATQR
jgi:protein SCO1/2